MLFIQFLLTNKRMNKKNGINPHLEQIARACCIPPMQMSNFLAFVSHFTVFSFWFCFSSLLPSILDSSACSDIFCFFIVWDCAFFPKN